GNRNSYVFEIVHPRTFDQDIIVTRFVGNFLCRFLFFNHLYKNTSSIFLKNFTAINSVKIKPLSTNYPIEMHRAKKPYQKKIIKKFALMKNLTIFEVQYPIN